MRVFKYVIICLGSIVASMLIASLGFALFLLPGLLQENLLEGSYFNSSDPQLPIKRAFGPLALNVWDVSLDGAQIPVSVARTGDFYLLRISDGVTDGTHLLSYRLSYAPFDSNSVQMTSRFTVDTKTPEVTFPGAETGLVVKSGASYRTYWAISEPGVELTAKTDAGRPVDIEADSSGHFRLAFEPQNNDHIWIEAKDLAGNLGNMEIPVRLDSDPPELTSVNFESGRSYFDPDFLPQLTISDPSTELKSVSLAINGNVVDRTFNVKETTFVADGIVRGRNTIELVAYDNAGNIQREVYSIDVYRTRLMIDLAKRELKLMEGQKLVKNYKISIGKEGFNTPRGTFKVIKKRKNPTWYNPKSDWSKEMPPTIGPGPGNPMGTRALYLNAPNIRIHGTYQSNSIGTAASHGCIRMLIKDSEELYELVPVGTPTVIS